MISERVKTTPRALLRTYAPLFIYPLCLFWLEMVVKIWDFGLVWNRGILFTSIFTLAVGIFLSAVCSMSSCRVNRILSLLLMGGLTIWYMVQAVYFTVLKTVMAMYSVSVAKDASEFWKVGVRGTWDTLPALVALAIPFVTLFLIGKKHTPDHLLHWRGTLSLILASFFCYGTGILTVRFSDSGILSPWAIYTDQYNPELSMSYFGVLATGQLEIQRVLFPPKAKVDWDEPTTPLPLMENTSAYANTLPIDFSAISQTETNQNLQDMNLYFSKRTPTMKNEYTGQFAGKNLILITAEAFSPYAVDPIRTPTLYRLSQEGFVAKNFYNPLWWASTSDGEYAACTGLIPTAGTLSLSDSSDNSMYFCLGNQLARQGYKTFAYHNHTYTYYNRNKSHPNMGYTYKGLGNGLPVTKVWPESDLEMMQLSMKDYIKSPPFHAYYMTVSGHLNYSFAGNAMAAKHREEVRDLPLSEEAQAYLACQIELDRALASVLDQLKEAGQLDNTVICLSGDHYPYGLAKKTIDELAGYEVDEIFELYRSTLILWSGDMETPIAIEKPCSSLDILPTLSNLFGLPYDSRLLVGRDMLSDAPGLVIFSDYSYISELGRYDAKKDSFLPYPGVTLPEYYAENQLTEVSKLFSYSQKILQTDYYRTLGLIPDSVKQQKLPLMIK
ncbi:MAG: LTA synthase family protein [Evtepia sp.]